MKGNKAPKKTEDFIHLSIYLFIACHVRKPLIFLFYFVYQSGHFHRERSKITAGKLVKNDKLLEICNVQEVFVCCFCLVYVFVCLLIYLVLCIYISYVF